MKIKSFALIIGALFVCILASCSSKEDEFVGKWSTVFGLTDGYTKYRVFVSEGHPSFMHTFTFTKGENGKPGTFDDNISPVAVGGRPDNQVVVGSNVDGTWEVKNGKLYLYYGDEINLTNAENLSEEDQAILELEMEESFFDDFRKRGENGVNYEFIKKNDKVALKIDFGNTTLTLKN